MSLLTVGTVAFDKLESPFGKTDKILGGAATYIGMASSLLGVDTAIVSVVGGDFPQEYIDLLISKGINLDGLEIVKEGKTFFWEGKYHNDLNTRDTLATELNVLETFNPVVPQDRKSPDVLMLGNLHPLVQKGVLTQLEKRPGLVVLDTMNFWMDCAWNELMDVIKDVDVISINDEDFRFLLLIIIKQWRNKIFFCLIGDPVLIYDLGKNYKNFDPNMDPNDTRVFIDIVFKTDPKTNEEKGIYYINYYYNLKQTKLYLWKNTSTS